MSRAVVGKARNLCADLCLALTLRIQLLMLISYRVGLGITVCFVCSVASGQLAPITDEAQRPLLPTGISELPVLLDGELAYIFSDEDGSEALHFVGNFSLKLGDREGLALHAREAVIWLTHRELTGRSYRHFQVLLWGDGEVIEVGGTVASGPALFVTLNSFGNVTTRADDVTDQSSADTLVYQQGNRIRLALLDAAVEGASEDVSLMVFDATGMSTSEGFKPRPVINFRSRGDLRMDDLDGGQVLTVTGGVYLSRGMPDSNDYLEIRADCVVVLIPARRGVGGIDGGEREPDGTKGAQTPNAADTPETRSAGVDGATMKPKALPFAGARPRQRLAAPFGEVEVEAVYLEGDVILSQGPNVITASRLYYDFDADRALILDAIVRTTVKERDLPLHLRAKSIKQLSLQHYTAEDAVLTTSEFHTPHYHVGARKIEFINRTPSEPSGRQGAIRAGSFRVQHATLNIGGIPSLYWPSLRGNLDVSETAIRGLRTGYSDDFGFELESDWHLLSLLGYEVPVGFDATLNLDYFSNRGPAVGVDVDYQRDTYFGLHRSYLMTEYGTDILGRDRERQEFTGTRGRFLWRHRHYLEDDWQVSFELSYISDKNFLEEFFEPEFDNDKEQETLVHLKKQRENWAFTALAQWRNLDFTTQTESKPDVTFRWIGEPLGTFTTLFSENRAGVVHYRPADQTFRELLRNGRAISSGPTWRADTRQELTFPLDVGPVRIVPFISGRGSVWDDSPEGNGLSRAFATYGLRGSMYLWKVYPEFESDLLDIHGLRHIVKPDFTFWASHTNVDSHELYAFSDGVEEIDEVDGVAFGLRERFQTKRGRGENRRTVDVLTCDWEIGVFNDSPGGPTTNGFVSYSRPENSIARNYFNSSMIWRVNDQTAFVTESSWDLNDGKNDIFNVSMVVERSPRLSYLVGYRLIEDVESSLLAFDANYRFNEKHTLVLRELFDLDRGRTLDFTIGLIRRFPRWYGALSFQLDEAEDDFGVSLSIWPEGLPQAALGSRRFTGLANTTRVRPGSK